MATPVDIKARITGDSRGFRAAADSAKKSAQQLRQELGTQLKGAVLSAFGIEAVRRFTRELSTQAKEIQEGADQLGVSVTQFQQLQSLSKRTGESMSEITKSATSLADALERARGEGTIFSAADLEAINTSREAIEDLARSGTGLVGGTIGATRGFFQSLFASTSADRAFAIAEAKDSLSSVLSSLGFSDAATRQRELAENIRGRHGLVTQAEMDALNERRINAEAAAERENQPGNAEARLGGVGLGQIQTGVLAGGGLIGGGSPEQFSTLKTAQESLKELREIQKHNRETLQVAQQIMWELAGALGGGLH